MTMKDRMSAALRKDVRDIGRLKNTTKANTVIHLKKGIPSGSDVKPSHLSNSTHELAKVYKAKQKSVPIKHEYVLISSLLNKDRFTDEALGRVVKLSGADIREYLEYRISKGDVFISDGECPNFRPDYGCACWMVESNQGHHADQQKGDTPEAAQSHSNDVLEDGKSDHPDQPHHPAILPASERVRKSENLMSKEETSMGFVERLIRESIQVIPLELVRINTPAVVLVKVPDTGEENRYMMTLTPIDRSLDA